MMKFCNSIKNELLHRYFSQRLAESLFVFLKLKNGYFEEAPLSECFLPLFFNNPIVLISCKCQTVECHGN